VDYDAVFGDTPSDGENNHYHVEWNTSTTHEDAYVGSTKFLSTTWNPFSIWAYIQPDFYGNALYLESDIPGNATTPTVYTDLEGQVSSSNDFSDYGCDVLSHENDGGAKRSDGESWWDHGTGTCPEFENYTDTAG
jgi:hypothetical protein